MKRESFFLIFKCFLVLGSLYLARPPFLPLLMTASVLLFFTPIPFKMPVLAGLNGIQIVFFTGLFVDSSFQFDRLTRFMERLQMEPTYWQASAFRFLGLLGAIGLLTFLDRHLRHENPLLSLGKFFFVLCAMIGLMMVWESQPAVNLFFWVLITIMAKYFWVLLYSLRAPIPVTLKENLFCSLNRFPFWSVTTNYHIHNIPRGVQELERKNESSREMSANGALESLLWCLGLGILSTLVWDLIFSQESWYRFSWIPQLRGFGYPSIYETGIRRFNDLQLQWFEIWAISLGHGICFLLKNASRLFAIVGVVRFCGFQLENPVQSLHKSNSFSDFVGRYYYYYSDFLKNYFYYPVLIWLDDYNIRSEWKKMLASFLAVFIGGSMAHFLIEVGRELETNSISRVLLYVGGFSPYLLLLATFVAISNSFSQAFRKKVPFHLLFLLIFLFAYNLCFSLQFYLSSLRLGYSVDVSDYWTFLKSFMALQ